MTGTLDGVSCTAATSCTAVGGYYTSTVSPDLPLAEYWDGSSWAVQTTATPAGSDGASFNRVTCTAAASCTAVGFATFPVGVHNHVRLPLAEQWNGTSWALETTPGPHGSSTQGQLYGVSCASAKSCTAAVTYSTTSNSVVTAGAQHWNGTRWDEQATASPQQGKSLLAISCVSGACTAVGYNSPNGYAGPFTPLAEQQ
ncbi:MAG TPA: hypothetical protein VGH27_21095 [Streptosporangiaceae bacterium]|jgi:hypothetical protein